MNRVHLICVVAAVFAGLVFETITSAQVTRERDVIYLRTEGVAMTFDVFKPANPNGIGIIKVVSGGWKSKYEKVTDDYGVPYTDHGYTVFAVMHGSQPRYQVRDIMGFMHRAVRFIRTHADRWDIDPDRMGVTGASAGGHLSLILATKGGPGDPDAKDPIDRASSAVQAAGVFFPPTDYLNWSEPGDDCVGVGKQERWQPAFGEESKTAETRQILGRHMSSIYHVSETTPPVSIIHGDADPIVPLFQSTSFKMVAEAKGVPIELTIKKGLQHGWPNKQADEVRFVKWFDQHLLAARANTYRIGTCDWSIKMQVSEESFEFAKANGLDGIQYSFDAKGNGLDLRTRENRDKVRAIVKETGVAISSLGIGLLNRVPLATTDEADRLVADCLEAMVMLKEEAADLEDRELAEKVSPKIVLLAFFGKADLNGDEERMNTVIRKLKRFAPIAEKHGFILGIESLLSEADHRRIMEGVGSPAVKVYYDTANSARMGYDIYREIESLGTENICEVHIKQDAALLGQGDIDFPRIRLLLDSMGYNGWLIIEGSKPKGMSHADATKANTKFARDCFNASP
ncbi:TIM barrel protein [Aporhodopirellula aestuarii]|uniref:TIM barrel protein n=1 Tax=Aporhodopirellula aestuarii TaxID=2950107 RepID=A0ABT0UCA4_9BACT|nr:TIM barrel protein [Aporhodopirellula aestuarii]MCM2373976.1 TIM barrel protein [Aporhodopirellula aestuarii]